MNALYMVGIAPLAACTPDARLQMQYVTQCCTRPMSCHRPHPLPLPLPPRSLALRKAPFPRPFLPTTAPLPSTACPFPPVPLIPSLTSLALSILCLFSARPSRVPWRCPVTRVSIRSTAHSSVRLGLCNPTSHIPLWRPFIASWPVSWTIPLR